MPKFGQTSLSRLETCHSDLQAIFTEVIKTVDCSILCGYRKEKEQNDAFIAGLSQLEWPLSKHNTFPSQAIDAGPYFADMQNVDWEDALAFAVFAGYVKRIAEELFQQGKITHRLRWGGDWDGDGRTQDEQFQDLPHFELVRV